MIQHEQLPLCSPYALGLIRGLMEASSQLNGQRVIEGKESGTEALERLDSAMVGLAGHIRRLEELARGLYETD